MNMKINQVTDLSKRILTKLGFNEEEAELITQNLIEAELVEKKTHGLVRLPSIAKNVADGKIKVGGADIATISEHPASLHLDGKFKPGFYVIYKSLERALAKAKTSGIVAVALKDLAYASGYIGDYARLATQQNLIFISWHNSPGGLVPFGTRQNLWGTNPLTIGVPTHGAPVILDMASSKCTFGDLLVAKSEGRQLAEGLAIDETGQPTIDPVVAMQGGILPIAGHKGSGLALMVELLAGGLSHSRVGKAVDGGWGSFYLLIDPSLFRQINEFKDDVAQAIAELKNASKAEGVTEIFFPGEQAHLKRQANLAEGTIEVSEKLMGELNLMLDGTK